MVLSPQHLYLHLNSGQLDQQSGKWQEGVITTSEGGSMEIQPSLHCSSLPELALVLLHTWGDKGVELGVTGVVAY